MWAVTAVLSGLLASGGCDFGEDRPFNYEKGVYLGEPHRPLDEATMTALRARAAHQSDAGVSAGGGGGTSVGRAPSLATGQGRGPGSAESAADGSAVSTQALRRRAAYQRSF